MKRLIVGCALMASAALAIGPGPVVKVDGKAVTFPGTQPQTITGRIMVPVRGIFEAIGAYVEYNPVHHRVAAKRGNEMVELRMGDRIAKRNGSEIELDVPPQSVRGRMMVPLRFIAESLGADVQYTKSTNTVEIFTNENIPGVKLPPPSR